MLDENSIIELFILFVLVFIKCYVNGNEYIINGFELIVFVILVKNKNFIWNVVINWSSNICKLIGIYGNQEKFGDLKKGDWVDVMYVIEWEKILDGWLILDVNMGLFIQSVFKIKVGNQFFDVCFGLQNIFKIKDFIVNIDMDGVIGGMLIFIIMQKMWWGGKYFKFIMYCQEEYDNGGKFVYVFEGVNIVSGEVIYDVNGNIVFDICVYKKNEIVVNIQIWVQNYFYCVVVCIEESELFVNMFSCFFLKLRCVVVMYDLIKFIQLQFIKGLDVIVFGNNLVVLKKIFYLDLDFGVSDGDLQDLLVCYVGVSVNIKF